VSFAFIAAEKAHYPVRTLCRALEVTPSGFYAWQRRPPSRRTVDDARLVAQLRIAHAESRRTYGRPRLHRALRAIGLRIGERRVRRLMAVAGLHARRHRRFRATTDSRDAVHLVSNRLRRRFHGTHPNAVWAADITACWTLEGWLYLAVVLDLASRRVVGWATRPHLETELPLAALHVALGARRPPPGLLHHSDRGVQYASVAYQHVLATHGIIPSMSRVGNCWDNAPVESFFSQLKTELLPAQPWATRARAHAALADHLRFYNRDRLHSALDYRSPAAYEAHLVAAHE
jgi:putative transposase